MIVKVPAQNVKTIGAPATEINFVKEISAKAHGDGYMSFSSNFWLDFVTVWGVIRLNLEPTQKADCISRIFIPKIDSPGRLPGQQHFFFGAPSYSPITGVVLQLMILRLCIWLAMCTMGKGDAGWMG